MLAIPALLSLGMMLLTTVRYQRAMDRMATVAGLKPVVGTQLPEQLFSVTAGRLDYEASGVDALVGSVDQTLDAAAGGHRGRGLPGADGGPAHDGHPVRLPGAAAHGHG